MSQIYDVIIIGGGPAGLTAGLYASRSHMETLVFEGLTYGGRITRTHWVDNYPGFPEGLGGYDLGQKIWEQSKRFGTAFQNKPISFLEKTDFGFLVKDAEGVEYHTRTLIVATGAETRHLGVPGEEEYVGRGVSYCATCDAPFYKGLNVAVVGGGDSALSEALYLTRFTPHVHLVHRRSEFRATAFLVQKVTDEPLIKMHLATVVKEIHGQNGNVARLELHNLETKETYDLPIDGVFLLIGYEPQGLDFLTPFVDFDKQGFIETDHELRTKTPGLFAAGDVRSGRFRQVVTASSDGALAAEEVGKYLARANA